MIQVRRVQKPRNDYLKSPFPIILLHFKCFLSLEAPRQGPTEVLNNTFMPFCSYGKKPMGRGREERVCTSSERGILVYNEG